MRGHRARRSLGIGLIAGATLLAELVLTRVLSAGLFHHLAFVVLSTAMLGTGVAGVVVSLGRASTGRGPARAALGFALSLPACYAIAQLLAPEPLKVAAEPTEQLLRMGATYALLATPFFFAGLTVAGLLSRHCEHATSLYAADLAGAAGGSLLALAALPVLGGQDALLLASALGAGAAWALGQEERAVSRLAALALAAFGLSSAARAAAEGPAWLPLHVSESKTTRGGEPFAQVLSDPRRTLSTRWTNGARVDHVRFSPRLERLVIDGGVAAVRVPLAGGHAQASDATLPYELRPGARVLIIGAGAGWEIREALGFGAARIDAVELDPAVAASIPADLAEDPKVRIFVDEGRSFAERAEGPYDVVIMVHTISNAASAAGAMHLAEDHLLTAPAFETLAGQLSQDGLLFVTRPEAQLPRLVSTLAAATEGDGPLAPRLALWAERSAGTSFYGAALMSRQPLSPEDLRQVQARLRERRGLRTIADPRGAPTDPLFAALLESPPRVADAASMSGLVLEPATDDRPFFHQRRRLSDLSARDLGVALTQSARARMALEDQPLAELSSVLVLAETLLVAALALAVPIVRRRQRGRPAAALRPLVYFAALGLGFMLFEVSLIQRLRLLLGPPTLAFAVVFTALLLGAGLGSFWGPRWTHPTRAPAAAALALIVLTALLSVVPSALLGAPAAARIAFSAGGAFATGLALGAPFPLGLSRLRPEVVPWAFAVNAFASVAATVIALLVAAELGFTAVAALAVACYGLAAASFPRQA